MIYKNHNKKNKLMLLVYLKMFIFMIQKLIQMKKINFKFMLAVMDLCNNSIEILKEIKTHQIKLNIHQVQTVLMK